MFQEFLIKGLNKACSLLPAPASTKCQEVVETFGPSLMDILMHEVSPNFVCSLLHLCSDGLDVAEILEQPASAVVSALPREPALSKQPELPTQSALRGECKAH